MVAIRRTISTHKKKRSMARHLRCRWAGRIHSSADEFRRGIDAAESLAAAELRVDAQGFDRD
jgi:hypothetical protein